MRDRRLIAVVLLALAGSAAQAEEALGPVPGNEVNGPASAMAVYDPLFDEDADASTTDLDSDPFEPVNRGILTFNDGLDTWILDPITNAYKWLVPSPARRGVSRFFANLKSPVIFANQILQLRPVPAAKTLGRFAANTSLGVVGFFDFADDVMGMPRVEADFGQTLYRYGMPRGPYMVLPLLGPSTARDVVGTVIDQGLDPLTYVIGPFNFQWQLVLGGGQGIATRESNAVALESLRVSSVDFYSALRSAYLQSRRARELEVRPDASLADEVEGAPQPAAAPDQDSSVPAASFAMRSSIAAISASKSWRLTIPENSERRSASSLTMPSR